MIIKVEPWYWFFDDNYKNTKKVLVILLAQWQGHHFQQM